MEVALKAYQHIRLPLANHVLIGSKESGCMYEFNGPDGENYERLGENIQKQWDWIWETDPNEDASRGIQWFRNKLQLVT